MRKTDLSRKNQRLFRSVQAFSRPFGSVDEKGKMDGDGDEEARDWQKLREHDPAGLHKLVQVFWFLRALYIYTHAHIKFTYLCAYVQNRPDGAAADAEFQYRSVSLYLCMTYTHTQSARRSGS